MKSVRKRTKKQGSGRFLWTDGQNPLPPSSVRPFRLSHTGWIDGRNGRTDQIPFPSINPSINPSIPSITDGRKIPFFDGIVDGREYQKSLIFPSVHYSIRKRNFPSMFDGQNGRIDGRMDGRKRKVIRPSISSINPSTNWTD